MEKTMRRLWAMIPPQWLIAATLSGAVTIGSPAFSQGAGTQAVPPGNASTSAGAVARGPEYTAAGELKFPDNYREWVYLSSGFDMSYNPAMRMGHHMFDNVFVNPESYRQFVLTGTWPDKTLMVLEAR